MAGKESPNGSHVPHDSALSVGPLQDAVRVDQLEAEVKELADKANNASQRFADYENEIRVLQAQLRQQQRRNDATVSSAESGGDGAQAAAQVDRPGISRFGSFMHSRKASALQPNGAAPSSREKELEAAFIREQTSRIAAEQKVTEVNAEIEELSASLFQQANEMVAAERKENAMLRDRLEIAEQQASHSSAADGDAVQQENSKLRERVKTLQQRDFDRRRRLEKLETAHKRIEGVRTMLIPR
ncbi:hypothetical protein LTR36_002058 [Oleoguttula mirabilis]|uniref:GDP/GTP exchange factor Sec2 N-terminal domain-containing protein n=1 Tax=Oleoguttula mirabilis TaxID=1507867 RepID=A0AAV9JLJ2_9PEZI|nr:hypothetical protein LTR36_002058 [Oleoguttula mirabilis]